jgi:hypothetical protein
MKRPNRKNGEAFLFGYLQQGQSSCFLLLSRYCIGQDDRYWSNWHIVTIEVINLPAMNKNTITVTAYLVNGSSNEVLTDASPKDAIEEYLMPDMRPPVQTLVIKAITSDGKEVKLSISQSSITATIT